MLHERDIVIGALVCDFVCRSICGNHLTIHSFFFVETVGFLSVLLDHAILRVFSTYCSLHVWIFGC